MLYLKFFLKTVDAIQGITNTGWILSRGKWCRAPVMLGGNSPWLQKVLGISAYFRIGSIYTDAMWSATCLDMCTCVVRRTLSVCKSCASGVQRVQVGCWIVQPQVAHSVPIFLSVPVAHGRPWVHDPNNSNNCYNSYKQVGAEALERQVDPYRKVGAGVKRAGVKRQLVVGLQRRRSRKLMSHRATHQQGRPPCLECNPTSRVKVGCWCTIFVTRTPRSTIIVWRQNI